jgi:hypothetical protein
LRDFVELFLTLIAGASFALGQEAAEMRQNRGKCAVIMAQQPRFFSAAALAQHFARKNGRSRAAAGSNLEREL